MAAALDTAAATATATSAQVRHQREGTLRPPRLLIASLTGSGRRVYGHLETRSRARPPTRPLCDCGKWRYSDGVTADARSESRA